MLCFASAQTDSADSAAAMHEGIDALARELERAPDVVLVYASIGHDLAELLAAAARSYPNTRVVGCTSAGVIGRAGASERMRTLAMMGIAGDELGIGGALDITAGNAHDKAAEAAVALKRTCPGVRQVVLFVPGIDIAGDRVIAGIESVLGPEVVVFGGSAGDNMRARVAYQLLHGRVHEGAIALVGLANPTLDALTGTHHGSVPVGRELEATQVDGHRLQRLEGEPAWPLLMNELGLPADTAPGDALVLSALGELLPEPLRGPYRNNRFIHTIFRLDDDQTTCLLPSALEPGTTVRLMQREEKSMFAGVEAMTADLARVLAGRRPVAVFHADCGARGRMMFNRVLKDEIIQRLQYPLVGDAAVPWLGTYGFGEFCPVAGVNRFHTQTSSLCALVRAG